MSKQKPNKRRAGRPYTVNSRVSSTLDRKEVDGLLERSQKLTSTPRWILP